MGRDITRRDFIHDVSLATLGISLSGAVVAGNVSAADGFSEGPAGYYPPTKTGLRGSHAGSFEVAHELAIGGRKWDAPKPTGEEYDLVVVGGGISGLAAAYFYRKKHGPGSRILILDNHDDFGGHAKRNEFHQGGRMRLAWGGAINIEQSEYSPEAMGLLTDLGVNIVRLDEHRDFDYGYQSKTGPPTFFDEETYGRNELIKGLSLTYKTTAYADETVDQFPISQQSRDSLKRFFKSTENILEGKTEQQKSEFLHATPYLDFLIQHCAVTQEAAALFINTTHGIWGVGADSLSVYECMWAGLPARHVLGDIAKLAPPEGDDSEVLFPDGNASIARLLVRSLIPGVARGDTMEDIVTAIFDYSKLDLENSPVRLRLNSTVVAAANKPDGSGISLTYVKNGQAFRVSGRQCIMACYHSIIPSLCPELGEQQKTALAYQVKRPMLVTNVMLRSSRSLDDLGISGAYFPGRMIGRFWLIRGISLGDYVHKRSDDGTAVLQFFGSIKPTRMGMHIKDQHRDSRRQIMALTFEDYEREVRTVLDGMLSPAGFDVKKDILAITVNRWPHGYAYDYLDLWDPDWPKGQAPHEIARKPFGNIAIANSDAGADAFTHVAIDQAWRAVNDLSA